MPSSRSANQTGRPTHGSSKRHPVRLEPVDGDDPRVIARALRDALHGAGPALGLGMVHASPMQVDAGTAVVVTTSGSTGVPKSVVLSRNALIASAMATAARIGEGTWLLALPASYVAGLQVLVRSLVSDREPALLRGVFTPQAFAATALMMISTEGGSRVPTYTSLVPAQLSRLLDAAEGGDERRVGEARVDGVVEPPDEVVVGLETVAAHQLGGAVELVDEGCELGRIAAGRGERCGGRLERLAQFEQFTHVVDGCGRDHEPAPGLRFDEPVGGETRERLAQRRAGDAEPGGLLDFAEHRAGREAPLEDLLPQHVVGPVAGASVRHAHRLNVYTEPRLRYGIAREGAACIHRRPLLCIRGATSRRRIRPSNRSSRPRRARSAGSRGSRARGRA